MPKPGSARVMPARGIANFEVLAYFKALVDFFRRWVGKDIKTIAASLAVLGGLQTGLGTVSGFLSGLGRFLGHFFTSSMTIHGKDSLNREVINWLACHVLDGKQTRSLLAQSHGAMDTTMGFLSVRDDRPSHQQIAIKYLPTFDVHYFWFQGTFMMVQRNLTNGISLRSLFFDRSTEAPKGKEPLLITCVARSVDPIKKFLTECKQFAKSFTNDYVSIQTCSASIGFDTQLLRSPRPLETVHFDQQVKDDLVTDIAHYLRPETREFYHQRGIPYRRGYLLHGPPGTGKSSLSFAIAGHFKLELMVVDFAIVLGDHHLAVLFADLPAQCIVLLEDIDAVGLTRSGAADKDKDEDGDEEAKEEKKPEGKKSRCTLSGLLNVLDGVVAQQGRIVLMTTNREAELDEALTRPGRIDKKIYLGNIGTEAARQMFVRMYAPDHTKASPTASAGLLALADRFGAAKELDRKFTPAQVQEYLLRHRDSPRDAVEGLQGWIDEENRAREEKEEEKEEEKKEKASKASDEKEKEKTEKNTAEKDKDGESTTKESEETDDAATKVDDDKNDSSKSSSDVGEAMLTPTEDSSGNQSDNSDPKGPPVEPEKND
ncbi:hypothetical protein PG985_012566 [Apiospora marii]|uniref:AAA+ ATPase domain-containing protein n=1 Tax=Apiospora marii TaxID=335849 RepID=A0ABR1RCW9_9PEZI